MTQQVRRGYRSHRKATWAVVALVTVVVAAAVTPFATGAPPKYYLLTASPAEVCFTGPGQVEEFELTLTNDARNNSLGSAEITAPGFITPTSLSGAPAGSSIAGNVIKLRNLATLLPTQGSAITVTVEATVLHADSGTWDSVAKQANDFADTPGPGNLFQLRGGAPTLTTAACNYVFVEGPVTAEKGSPQTVKVQLQAGGTAVSASGPLTLTALRNSTTLDPQSTYFDELTSSGQDATKTWVFSLTGNVSATGYALRAGTTTSTTFAIVDGLCQPNTTDPEHLASSCSLTSNFNSGFFESGVTINDHKLEPIAITFAKGEQADGKCEPWNRATYGVNGTTYTFPGVELDFGWGGGVLRVIYRVRNSEWVLTEASRGNSDIEICAGAKHDLDDEKNGDGSDPTPFQGKYGPAVWNEADGLYWGVLASVANPNKVKEDPVVCSVGNQSLPTGPNGASETWRAWTICIPSDWDWKNFG